MVTIAQAATVLEAHLLRMRLEAVGITAIVDYEYALTWNPLWQIALGWVPVRVSEREVPEALEFLQADRQLVEPSAVPECPCCESTHTVPNDRRARLGAWALISIWFLMVAPPWSFTLLLLYLAALRAPRGGWRCGKCKHQFFTTDDFDQRS